MTMNKTATTTTDTPTPSSITVQDRRGFEMGFLVSAIMIILGVWLSIKTFFLPEKSIQMLILSLILLVLGIGLFYEFACISQPPRNNPAAYVKNAPSDGKKVLVCLGDSITQGRCSSNFVDCIPDAITTAQLTASSSSNSSNDASVLPHPLEIVNAGHNSICTWTILQEKIYHVTACKPDYIFIMIGTNDIKGIYNKLWGKATLRMWGIPEDFSFATFTRNLRSIVHRLVAMNPKACIGLCTIPPMGEDLDCRANLLVQKANDIIRDIVAESSKSCDGRVSLMDVYNAFDKTIRLEKAVVAASNGGTKKQKVYSVDWFIPLAICMGFVHYIFGISWTTVSGIVGNTVLSDSLHLNEVGGKIVVDLIVDWLRKAKCKENTRKVKDS